MAAFAAVRYLSGAEDEFIRRRRKSAPPPSPPVQEEIPVAEAAGTASAVALGNAPDQPVAAPATTTDKEKTETIEEPSPAKPGATTALSEDRPIEEAVHGIGEAPASEQSRVLEGKTFMFAGRLVDQSRDDATRAVVRLGGKVTSELSAAIDYFVAGISPGEKREEAEKRGLTIVDEEGFNAIINDASKPGKA